MTYDKMAGCRFGEWCESSTLPLRVVMRALAWVGVLLFAGYYGYLVLLFGATLPLLVMRVWLVNTFVTFILCECASNTVNMLIRLFQLLEHNM